MGNRKWTPKEDKALIAALCELSSAGWRRENGNFRTGYAAALEMKIKSRLPGCNIRANPHIESRLKVLKKHYDAINEMQGAAGIQWDSKGKVLTCEDDGVWEKWVQTHSDAKGLRNKEFPHYDELHLLFGHRGTKKGVNNELDCDKVVDDEVNIDDNNLIVGDSLEEDVKGNDEVFQNRLLEKSLVMRTNNDVPSVARTDCPTKRCGKWNTSGDVIRDALKRSLLPDQDDDDSSGTHGSDEQDLSADAIARTIAQPPSSTVRSLKRKCSWNCDYGSSEVGELAKIFGNFLEKYQEHLSLLGEIVKEGKDAAKIAGEKRGRLNGELKKLPNLKLQDRLRAASLIVTDPAKLDLFYSLSKEERREWVSMLLSGFI